MEPVSITNPVAARFLLDLLAGSNALGVDFGHIVCLDWQARDAGWLADDLVVTCKQSSEDRAASISIKSAQQVTRAGFPQDFVESAWAQWFGVKTDRKLRETNDAIILVTGSLAHDVKDAWSNLLFEALKTTPERMVKRLTEPLAGDGSQSSTLQRTLFASFRCLLAHGLGALVLHANRARREYRSLDRAHSRRKRVPRLRGTPVRCRKAALYSAKCPLGGRVSDVWELGEFVGGEDICANGLPTVSDQLVERYSYGGQSAAARQTLPPRLGAASCTTRLLTVVLRWALDRASSRLTL